MNKYFNDESLVIAYIQQLLNETYNSDIFVNGEYYTHFDMNYGFAHYIAKYLNSRYPLLDKTSIIEYNNIKSDSVRSLTKPISIMNYFLCSNNGKRLSYDVLRPYDEPFSNVEYKKIYNKYMVLENFGSDGIIDIEPANSKYIIQNDLPLFSFFDSTTNKYSVNNNIIFTLDKWKKEKRICEIDDLVASYLIGRTITPKSSRDDIYYAQKLLIRNREILREERGVWCMNGYEGTEYDFTQTIIKYQSERFDPISSNPIFVTGYFDIFTESCARKEVGDVENGIRGL